MSPLTGWIGSRSGEWRTWLRPDELHDESPIEVDVVQHGDQWQITYRGSIQDDAVTGSMVISEDSEQTTIAWTDTWHTEGKTETLAATSGDLPSYLYGPDEAPWRWSISVEPGTDALVIRHFNAPPGMDPVLAVEMVIGR